MVNIIFAPNSSSLWANYAIVYVFVESQIIEQSADYFINIDSDDSS